MSEAEKGVAWCFVEMLRGMHKKAEGETKESLEVAIQLIGQQFGLGEGGGNDEENRKKYQLPGGRTLVDLFQQAKAIEEPKEKRSGGDGDESGFAKFVEVLRMKGFFAGIEEGTPEFEKRLMMAREHFSKSRPKQQQPPSQPQAEQPPKPTTEEEEEEEEKKKTKKRQEEAEKHKAAGNAELAAGRHAEAVKEYTAAIEAWPQNAIYFANRAAALTHLGRAEEAVADCDKAIALNPDYARAYSRLGAALHSLGRFQEAIERGYDKALQLEPTNEAVIKNKSEAQQAMLLQQQQQQRASQPHQSGAAPTPSQPTSTTPTAPGAIDPSQLLGFLQQPGFGEMLQSPMFQQMAQQVMSNPELMSNLLGSLGGLSGSGSRPQQQGEKKEQDKPKQ